MDVRKPFTAEELEAVPLKLLRDGRWGNACVSLAEINGVKWTIKDFSGRNWLVRNGFARFLLNHEKNMVNLIQGIDGVPQEAFFVAPFKLALSFVPGKSLSTFPKNEVTPEFLLQAEELIRSLHAKEVVHLDTRGTGNWVVMEGNKPGLIDFQSSLMTRYFPAPLKAFLRDMDLGGVYKKWKQYCPEKMDDFRLQELERINKLRKLWIFKGYMGKRGSHKHGPSR